MHEEDSNTTLTRRLRPISVHTSEGEDEDNTDRFGIAQLGERAQSLETTGTGSITLLDRDPRISHTGLLDTSFGGVLGFGISRDPGSQTSLLYARQSEESADEEGEDAESGRLWPPREGSQSAAARETEAATGRMATDTIHATLSATAPHSAQQDSESPPHAGQVDGLEQPSSRLSTPPGQSSRLHRTGEPAAVTDPSDAATTAGTSLQRQPTQRRTPPLVGHAPRLSTVGTKRRDLPQAGESRADAPAALSSGGTGRDITLTHRVAATGDEASVDHQSERVTHQRQPEQNRHGGEQSDMIDDSPIASPSGPDQSTAGLAADRPQSTDQPQPPSGSESSSRPQSSGRSTLSSRPQTPELQPTVTPPWQTGETGPHGSTARPGRSLGEDIAVTRSPGKLSEPDRVDDAGPRGLAHGPPSRESHPERPTGSAGQQREPPSSETAPVGGWRPSVSSTLAALTAPDKTVRTDVPVPEPSAARSGQVRDGIALTHAVHAGPEPAETTGLSPDAQRRSGGPNGGRDTATTDHEQAHRASLDQSATAPVVDRRASMRDSADGPDRSGEQFGLTTHRLSSSDGTPPTVSTALGVQREAPSSLDGPAGREAPATPQVSDDGPPEPGRRPNALDEAGSTSRVPPDPHGAADDVAATDSTDAVPSAGHRDADGRRVPPADSTTEPVTSRRRPAQLPLRTVTGASRLPTDRWSRQPALHPDGVRSLQSVRVHETNTGQPPDTDVVGARQRPDEPGQSGQQPRSDSDGDGTRSGGSQSAAERQRTTSPGSIAGMNPSQAGPGRSGIRVLGDTSVRRTGTGRSAAASTLTHRLSETDEPVQTPDSSHGHDGGGINPEIAPQSAPLSTGTGPGDLAPTTLPTQTEQNEQARTTRAMESRPESVPPLRVGASADRPSGPRDGIQQHAQGPSSPSRDKSEWPTGPQIQSAPERSATTPPTVLGTGRRDSREQSPGTAGQRRQSSSSEDADPRVADRPPQAIDLVTQRNRHGPLQSQRPVSETEPPSAASSEPPTGRAPARSMASTEPAEARQTGDDARIDGQTEGRPDSVRVHRSPAGSATEPPPAVSSDTAETSGEPERTTGFAGFRQRVRPPHEMIQSTGVHSTRPPTARLGTDIGAEDRETRVQGGSIDSRRQSGAADIERAVSRTEFANQPRTPASETAQSQPRLAHTQPLQQLHERRGKQETEPVAAAEVDSALETPGRQPASPTPTADRPRQPPAGETASEPRVTTAVLDPLIAPGSAPDTSLPDSEVHTRSPTGEHNATGTAYRTASPPLTGHQSLTVTDGPGRLSRSPATSAADKPSHLSRASAISDADEPNQLSRSSAISDADEPNQLSRYSATSDTDTPGQLSRYSATSDTDTPGQLSRSLATLDSDELTVADGATAIRDTPSTASQPLTERSTATPFETPTGPPTLTHQFSPDRPDASSLDGETSSQSGTVTPPSAPADAVRRASESIPSGLEAGEPDRDSEGGETGYRPGPAQTSDPSPRTLEQRVGWRGTQPPAPLGTDDTATSVAGTEGSERLTVHRLPATATVSTGAAAGGPEAAVSETPATPDTPSSGASGRPSLSVARPHAGRQPDTTGTDRSGDKSVKATDVGSPGSADRLHPGSDVRTIGTPNSLATTSAPDRTALDTAATGSADAADTARTHASGRNWTGLTRGPAQVTATVGRQSSSPELVTAQPATTEAAEAPAGGARISRDTTLSVVSTDTAVSQTPSEPSGDARAPDAQASGAAAAERPTPTEGTGDIAGQQRSQAQPRTPSDPPGSVRDDGEQSTAAGRGRDNTERSTAADRRRDNTEQSTAAGRGRDDTDLSLSYRYQGPRSQQRRSATDRQPQRPSAEQPARPTQRKDAPSPPTQSEPPARNPGRQDRGLSGDQHQSREPPRPPSEASLQPDRERNDYPGAQHEPKTRPKPQPLDNHSTDDRQPPSPRGEGQRTADDLDLDSVLASSSATDRIVGKLYREFEKKLEREKRRRGLK